MLWGRIAETQYLARLVEDARRGRSGAVCVRGEAGIGKTTLLDAVAAAATDCRVLRAAGVEAEVDIAFGGLYGLLRPVLGDIGELPPPSASALAAALGLGVPVGAERFAVGAATLGLLSITAEYIPLLLIVDDLHWFDAGSRDALLFALRRLGPEGVAAVVSLRDPDAANVDVTGITTLHLGGLDPDAAHGLLGARGSAVSEAVAADLTRRTGGNPLALIEVAARLDERQRSGLDPVGEVLPVGPEVVRAFQGRLGALDERGRLALVVVALYGGGEGAAVADALRALGVEAGHLDAAERCGLLRRRAGEVAVTHPLVRAAVVESASPEVLRVAHTALADSLADPGRRAWHRALGAAGPDEGVAADLEATGMLAFARGDPLTASRALARAGDLSPGRDRRSRRHLAAGQAAAVAGAAPFALLETARTEAVDPDVADAALVMHAAVLAWSGQAPEFTALLADVLPDMERRAPLRAAELHGLAVNHCVSIADMGGSSATDVPVSGLPAAMSRTATPRAWRSWSRPGSPPRICWRLDGPPCSSRVRRCTELLEAGGGSIDMAVPMAGIVVNLDPVLSIRIGRIVTARARAGGRLISLRYGLAVMCNARWGLGEVRGIRDAAAEGAALAAAAPNAYVDAYLSGVSAMASAAMGDVSEVERLTSAPIAGFVMDAAPWTGALRHHARGLAALVAGDVSTAVTEMTRAWSLRGDDLIQPCPGGHDLVEALVRGGDPEGARAAAAGLPGAPGDAARARRLRCLALVCHEDDAALALFHEALSAHAHSPARLEAARTRLLMGERLRRTGRRTDAAHALTHAVSELEAVGAEGFAARARAELRAIGARVPRPRSRGHLDDLTPQERQVAAEVARGRTNREVAASLFISPKTVEMHLTRVYRKLGIRSRTELAHQVSRGMPA